MGLNEEKRIPRTGNLGSLAAQWVQIRVAATCVTTVKQRYGETRGKFDRRRTHGKVS